MVSLVHNHIPEFCLSTQYPEIAQSCTLAALIRLSTNTHNIFTFNRSEISSNNSEKLSLLADNTSYSSSQIYSHTVDSSLRASSPSQSSLQTSIDPVFTPEKVLVRVKVCHLHFCSRSRDLSPRPLFPRPKTLFHHLRFYTFLPPSEILTMQEITRRATIT